MFKVAAVQMAAKDKKQENIERALKFIRVAVEKDVKLIAFPELFATKWFPCEINKDNFNLAEAASGETVSIMKEQSKKYSLVIFVPFFERYRNKYYNSCAVVDCGKLVGIYRKVHVPNIPLWEEAFYFSSGKEFPVFETSLGKMGVQICFDNFYPEGYRILTLKGAELIITPTASAFSTQKRWRAVIYTHALLNNVFILRVNRTGEEKLQEFYGNSFLISPDGVISNEPAGKPEGLYIANVDLEEVKRVRKIFPFLDGRKPKLYSEIVKGRNDE